MEIFLLLLLLGTMMHIVNDMENQALVFKIPFVDQLVKKSNFEGHKITWIHPLGTMNIQTT